MSRITSGELDAFIRGRRFAELFIRCGWDREGVSGAPLPLAQPTDGDPGAALAVEVVAEKRGFAVCVCDAGAAYPHTRAARRRLSAQLSRHHYEHLLIICGEGKQCWSAAIRPHNRPMRNLEVVWRESQDIQRLKEKLDGIIFDISDEENIGVTDVVEQVRSAFMANADQITRRFYREFQTELSAFAEFIDGISAQIDRDWYAALMLNRLMFIYFIQKKNFLDNDPNYLENRLRQTQAQFGKDQFEQKFYRHFLRRLFTEGLGTPPQEREPELREIIGKVPYLNGGLFDLHDIEKDHESLAIPDAAFERLFAFFAQYQWHLDSRSSASGKDINPDVLGYIFEKYINDRAAMGAYYTQEDITGYIARNTIIPFLLQRAKAQCANAFHADGVWRFLRDNPDHYIYEAARKGCDIPDSELPDNIRRGLDADAPELLARRKDWNTAADERFALPTETWREVVARRARYVALKEKMQRGGIRRVDDLITHNLDIERFAADALRDYEGSDFIAAFYAAIAGRKSKQSNHEDRRGVTVLDPACGSGAFLFAALNVLESLYEACIERMRKFVDDDDAARAQKGKGYKSAKVISTFRDVLRDIDKHSNPKYWIYKTIILNNLYGVDLMKEAAEIAKLRLFLKLAAEAKYDPGTANLGLEPLPDIDFNIRAGNSLVGFASLAEFESVATSELDLSGGLISQIREDARTVRMADNAFRKAQNYQAQNGKGGEDYRRAKRDLAGRLDALNRNMNSYLAKQYGIDDAKPAEYAGWQDSHKPFHWLAEFYGIVEEDGGFDVVIGNPPYVEYSKVKKQYAVKEYKTESCGNIYAMFVERAFALKNAGRMGMIVQLPIVCTDRMIPAQKLFSGNAGWFLNFDDRPGKLFADLQHIRATIFLTAPSDAPAFVATKYQRWYSKTRETLFQTVDLNNIDAHVSPGIFPKLGDSRSAALLDKIGKHKTLASALLGSDRKHCCYFHNSPQYWTRATDFVPYFWNEQDGEKQSTTVKSLAFSNPAHALAVCALLNSSLFYWWFILRSDGRGFGMREIENFPFNPSQVDEKILAELASIVGDLMADYRRHAVRKETQYKTTGKVVYDEFHPGHSKPIMDKIDAALAKHYNFTEAELDYIINYDIKYRMGGGKSG